MKGLRRDQQKAVVLQWKRAAPALARAREEELTSWQYDAATVDALLDIGAKSARRDEEQNGLVEMQRHFMALARKQGLLPVLREESAPYGAPALYMRGGDTLPLAPRLAILRSVRCPGKLIHDTYDLCQRLRAQGITVISGFHSPMERECLRLLLRSPNRVIWCLARGMLQAVPPELRAAVADGRLLLVSSFPPKVRRATAPTAAARNRLVADLAAAVFVPHAAAGSKIEALCHELLSSGKRLFTFEHAANTALLQAGAQAATPETDWKQVLEAGRTTPANAR